MNGSGTRPSGVNVNRAADLKTMDEEVYTGVHRLQKKGSQGERRSSTINVNDGGTKFEVDTSDITVKDLGVRTEATTGVQRLKENTEKEREALPHHRP